MLSREKQQHLIRMYLLASLNLVWVDYRGACGCYDGIYRGAAAGRHRAQKLAGLQCVRRRSCSIADRSCSTVAARSRLPKDLRACRQLPFYTVPGDICQAHPCSALPCTLDKHGDCAMHTEAREQLSYRCQPDECSM